MLILQHEHLSHFCTLKLLAGWCCIRLIYDYMLDSCLIETVYFQLIGFTEGQKGNMLTTGR